MKTHLTFLVFLFTLLASVKNIKAQPVFDLKSTSCYKSIFSIPTGKVTSSEPLLAVANYSYDGSYKIIDSNSYTWSSLRTSVQQHIPFPEVNAIEYDALTRLNIYGGSLDFNSRCLQSYTVDGLISEKLQQGWSSGLWVNNELTNYTYSSLLLQESVTKNWNISTSSWEFSIKQKYSYSSGQLDNIITQYWNPIALIWINTNRFSYRYLGTDTTEFLSESWDGANWVNDYKKNYSYVGGKMIENIEQSWDVVNNLWQNTRRWDYVYSGLLLEKKTIQNWNSSTSTWQSDARNTYSYIAAGLVTDHYEIWNNDMAVWQSYYKYLYDYSGTHVSKMIIQYWDTTSHSLENRQQLLFQYNSKNDLSEVSIYSWYGGKWQHPLAGYSAFRKYYYASSTSSGIENYAVVNAFLSPNPVQGLSNTTLYYYASQVSKIEVCVYNQIGQRIFCFNQKSEIGCCSFIIPTESFSSGAYFVQLIDETRRRQSFKLIKLE
jgi:hypothetical protein